MADQPCLGSVDFPTLASCDPRNHYLASAACMEASKPTLLAGQYTFLLVGGWLCNSFCPTVLARYFVPECFEAFRGGRNLWLARCMEESARAPAATYYRMGNRL